MRTRTALVIACLSAAWVARPLAPAEVAVTSTCGGALLGLAGRCRT